MHSKAVTKQSRRLVFWGTYDTGKPRVRLLLAGARAAGFDVLECHRHIWDGIEDKSQLRGVKLRVRLLLRWLAAYPSLIRHYLKLPAHDAVIIGYPGIVDVLVLWPLTRLRGSPLVWDVFMSLYDTVVRDRRLLPAWSPLAWGIYGLEWVASRAASRPFLDTRAHAAYFARLFRLDANRVSAVPVGAEEVFFDGSAELPEAHSPDKSRTYTILFYGQFIPLHGLDIVIEAAALVARETPDVRWVIIGHGQEAHRIDARLSSLKLSTVTRIEWVPYQELAHRIRAADACLGIFGTSEKARNVVPNKVYQILAMGRRVITSDTAGQRELLAYGSAEWLTLVPPGNARALADAVLRLRKEPDSVGDKPIIVGAEHVGRCLKRIIDDLVPN